MLQSVQGKKVIPQVLINNGSTIIVCPIKTTRCLSMLDSKLTPSVVTVQAYDNTRRAVLGSIILDFLVGPAVFPVDF